MLNVILDLDNTLISSIDETDAEAMGLDQVYMRQRMFNWKYMDRDFKVFLRPGLQEFLSWLFKKFNVSVWTAASKSYALFIVDNFILNRPGRKLDYILFSHHCDESIKYSDRQKNLKVMIDKLPLEKYTFEDTVIIDDSDEVYETQPDRCIHIKPFDVASSDCTENDKELQKVMKILKKWNNSN